MHGSGDTLGPDLSLIGKKYERAALLETILEPSKAIAPEYVSYVAVTDDGRGAVGFLVEKTEREVVLKDAQKQLIRIPADKLESLTAQSKSIMPDLVLCVCHGARRGRFTGVPDEFEIVFDAIGRITRMVVLDPIPVPCILGHAPATPRAESPRLSPAPMPSALAANWRRCRGIEAPGRLAGKRTAR